MLRTNRYDEATGTLQLTAAQVRAFGALRQHYGDFFGVDSTENGLIPQAITDPAEIHDLTSFFGWTAWASAAERPGHDYSYTNNWPPEPRVDNSPTADILVWCGLSLIALLVGTGILFARLRAVEPADRLARHGEPVAGVQAARRGGGHPRPAGHGLVLLRRRPALPGPGPVGLRGRALPGRPRRASSVWTWRRSCRSTWPAPGMCSSRCSGRRPRSSPPGSSWRPIISGREPRTSTPDLRPARGAGPRGRRLDAR